MEGRKNGWVRKQTSSWASGSQDRTRGGRPSPSVLPWAPAAQALGALSLEGTLSLAPPWALGALIPPTWAVRGRRAPSFLSLASLASEGWAELLW